MTFGSFVNSVIHSCKFAHKILQNPFTGKDLYNTKNQIQFYQSGKMLILRILLFSSIFSGLHVMVSELVLEEKNLSEITGPEI